MRKVIKTIAKHRVNRFGILGAVNTLLDIILLNILRITTHTLSTQTRKLVVLNIISASTVAVFSFFMNKKYVFQKQDTHHTKVWLFIAVTLSGIFILQSLVIGASLPLVAPFAEFLKTICVDLKLPILSKANISFFSSNLAKVIATVVTMIWNYTLYKKLIFEESRTMPDISAPSA
jgi:putative flippase GtrA